MKRHYVGFLIAALLFSLLFSPPAMAKETACSQVSPGKIPVLLVHGFASWPGMWTEDSGEPIYSYLSRIENAQLVEPFDYEANHFDWVTNENIGPKLAQTIDCLARKSRASGSKGKVIVVAHSMGGLAARYAANQVIDGRPVADELGLVITLATPHLGSPWATQFGSGWRWYCELLVGDRDRDRATEIEKCKKSEAITGLMEGSSQLRILPSFPANVPVRAITGQVKIVSQVLFGSVTTQLSDDLVVSVQSAVAQFTEMGKGDGKLVFQCEMRTILTLLPSYSELAHGEIHSADCSHNELYKTPYIQEAVKNGITEYIASTKVPVISLYSLELPLPANWKPAPNGEYASYVDDSWTVLYDETRCENPQWPNLCPTIVAVNLNGPENKDPYGNPEAETGQDCYWDHLHDNTQYGKPRDVATLQVDGEMVIYQQQPTCAPDYQPDARVTGMLHVWRVPSRNLVLFTGENDLDAGAADVVKQALATATWK